MNLLGTEHSERYAQLKHHIEPKATYNYFYIDRTVSNEGGLLDRLDLLTSELTTVGPFGSMYLKSPDHNYKSELMDVPLVELYDNRPTFWNSGIALYAVNLGDSVLLENEALSLLDQEWYGRVAAVSLACITVKLARNTNGNTNVCSLTCVKNLQPIGYYAHPSNSRLVEAMSGNLIPDRSFMTLGGVSALPHKGIFKAMMESSLVMNDFFDFGISKAQMCASLMSQFEQAK